MIGSQLGRYRLLSELGSGGMGTVYLGEARDPGPDVPGHDRVAIKLLHPHLIREQGTYRRFLREAEIGMSLSHPNVVRTYAAQSLQVDDQSLHFLVMEFVEGQTLRSLLDELGQMPEELCRHIGREIARALEAIHRAGAVHRDLKPENVLLTPDHVVKVMDLGVALLTDEMIRLSQTGLFVGSLRYAAPEQLAGGRKVVDGRADLHALGVMLYELASGTQPLAGDSFEAVVRHVLNRIPPPVRELRPEISPFFEEVLRRLLEKDAARRFPTASDLLQTLVEGEASDWWQGVTRASDRLAAPLRSLHVRRETALYGREAELAQLEELYDKSCSGEAQVVLLEGEAGIGKTRLIDGLMSQLRARGDDVHFLFGSYPPGSAASSIGAFTSAFRQHFAEQDLDQALTRYLSASPRLAPVFAALLRGETPPNAERLPRDLLPAAFVQATRGLAAERPTVIAIEDLHFAPEEGRALFAALDLGLQGHRVLLIGTARPGLPTDWLAEITRHDSGTCLPLTRLGQDAQDRILTDALGSEALAADLGPQIAAKSDGNPFFLFELLRGLGEGGFLTRGPDGQWVKARPIADLNLPSSVVKVLQARIDALNERARELLEAGSCWGHEFDPVLVANALGQDPLPVLRELARVERHHRLIRPSGRRYAFDHHQIQETLYAGLFEPLRERYHALLATTLETREQAAQKDPAALPGEVAVALCEQYLKGAQPQSGARYLHAAMTHLIRAQKNSRAVDLANRALAPAVNLPGAERITLLVRKQGLLGRLGRRDEQSVVLAEAIALANTIGDSKIRAQVQEKWGQYLDQVARFEEARSALTEAADLARTSGDHYTELLAIGTLGSVFHNLGHYEDAKRCQEQCLTGARAHGMRRVEQLALGDLGVLYNNLGQQTEALRFHQQSLELATELGEYSGVNVALGNIGNVLRTLGRFDEAIDHHRRQMELAREYGDRWEEAASHGGMSGTLHALGRYEEALTHLQRQLVLSRETRHRRSEAVALGNIGICYIDLGRYEDARRYCEQHRARSQELSYRLGETLALFNLCAVYHYQGDDERALETCELAERLCSQLGAKSIAIHGTLGRSLIALQQGDLAAAEQWGRRAQALAIEIEQPIMTAKALVALGEMAVRAGRQPEAREWLTEALTIARRIGASNEIAITSARLATLPDATGPADALAAFSAHAPRMNCRDWMAAHYYLWQATGHRSHLEAAHARLLLVCEHASPAYRQSIVEGIPLHREIAAAFRELTAASPFMN